ncbi:hypothetical protein DPMN_078897 [Dreissena polymorpha]|uniref:Uncharacterized protein n=1 Tax=Dreissena polymorpha TaxID=45954 RepID=A0A9D3YS16_DREPO|nr:hypothetical protein DPMN_078897 [Dreissena polymorpha]
MNIENPGGNFHEDWTKMKNAPPPGGHVFQPTGTIFQLVLDFIGTTINVACIVLTRKNAPPHWCPCFSTNHIIVTNLLTNFYDYQTINVASKVLSRKKVPPPYIIRMNLLTRFHEDRTINVASRTNLLIKVLTRKNARPLGGHVFQPTRIIFELIQDIIRTNLLTKFHKDRTINVASIYSHIRKNAPPPGGHVFKTTRTIFSNLFYYSLIRKNAPPTGVHIFQPTGIIYVLMQDIIGMNLLTKFQEDPTIYVTSRVLTSHIARKNVPPLGGHVFQANVTIFELIQDRPIFLPNVMKIKQ